ncbi:MAG: hypothetical protein PWP06_891 [Candidatus Marinimicrobia bacterium]|jgi:hypothetical protein|nr:hypothetical protein [Candidatus Neomarinimicrobiota bacterium]
MSRFKKVETLRIAVHSRQWTVGSQQSKVPERRSDLSGKVRAPFFLNVVKQRLNF